MARRWIDIRNAMLTLGVALLVIGAFCQWGCSQPPLVKAEGPQLAPLSQAVGDHATAVKSNSDKSDAAATKAEQKAPVIAPEMRDVKDANADNRSRADQLAVLSGQLLFEQKKAEKLAGDRDEALAAVASLKKQLAEASDKANQWERRATAAIRIASGISVAVALALLFMGTIHSALPAIIAAAVFVGATVAKVGAEYEVEIAIACTLVTVAAGVYALWNKRRGVFEITDAVRAYFTDPVTKVVTIPAEFAKLADLAQSTATKALVDLTEGNGLWARFRRWIGGGIAGSPAVVKS